MPTEKENDLVHIEEAIEAIKNGEMVVVVDDEDRENEGDIIIAAEKVTPEIINFIIKEARGLICLCLTEEKVKALNLPMMVENNNAPYQTAFTVSIEAKEGVTTGISAADRAHTILTAASPESKASDIVMPGHIFPLKARSGGVLVRTGHTEAAIDLATLAGLTPAGVLCEIINDDGTMARMPDLKIFSEKHGLKLISIEDLIEYRSQKEKLVHLLVHKKVVHHQWGEIDIRAFGTKLDDKEHLVISKGDFNKSTPLVRVQNGYPFSHIMGDLFSKDRKSLNASLKILSQEESCVLLCLDSGGSPKSLAQRIHDIAEVNSSEESIKKPEQLFKVQKQIGIGAQILKDLGLKDIKILSSSPKNFRGLSGHGIRVVEEVIFKQKQ